jgi:hypothetical protein
LWLDPAVDWRCWLFVRGCCSSSDHLAEHNDLAPILTGILANLNDPIASLKAGLDHRPELLEGCDQSRSPAVA